MNACSGMPVEAESPREPSGGEAVGLDAETIALMREAIEIMERQGIARATAESRVLMNLRPFGNTLASLGFCGVVNMQGRPIRRVE